MTFGLIECFWAVKCVESIAEVSHVLAMSHVTAISNSNGGWQIWIAPIVPVGNMSCVLKNSSKWDDMSHLPNEMDSRDLQFTEMLQWNDAQM